MKKILLNLSILSSLSVWSQSIGVDPNPLNNVATVNYTLASNDTVSIFVYDVTGQVKDTVLLTTYQVAGAYQKPLDITGLSDGIYMVILKYGAKYKPAKIVKTSEPLGLEKNLQLSEIIPYPNPTKDFLAIPTQPRNTTLSVMDSQGKVIYSFDGKTDFPSQIDLRPYSKGIYFLKFNHEGKQQMFKVAKY